MERAVRSLADTLRELAQAIDFTGDAAFGEALVRYVDTVVPIDSALVLHYRRHRRPDVLFDGLVNAARGNSLEAYLSGLYLLDPFYIHSKSLTEPKLLRMRDIAPRDFETSEYFIEYYKRSKVADEINIIVPTDPGRSLALCIERSAESGSFTDPEIESLRELQPVVVALFRAHARLADSLRGEDAGDREHERLEETLNRLGISVLTPREAQVMRLMLDGYSAAALAEILGVSVETVRVHRRNIYEKLHISSLAELFNLALKAIATPAEYKDQDPLLVLKPGLAG
ncbi:MAG: helix-turn-helix transcriptional regulator [Rhodospirillales bacterium]|nr:helix-turn-helix transcriptional regulator [Rhodospirillales bacterium]